jgi:pyrroloquinoline quinone (PQQ) biosynthesis protein C
MIADSLRAQIEQYAATFNSQNPLFTYASKGLLSVEHLTLYLANVRAVVAHTPIHLARALEAAQRRSDTHLATHFAERIREEDGHEEWAILDLATVSRDAKTARTDVLPSVRAQLAHIEATIDEDPTLYLAYILFAEYITVLVGPALLSMLEERCGIPRSAMSVVANHAELDVHHVQDALEKIDDLVGSPEKLPALRRVLGHSIHLFDRFCSDVVRSFPEADHVRIVPARRGSVRHVSAS